MSSVASVSCVSNPYLVQPVTPNGFAQIGNSLLAIGTALQSGSSAGAQTALANFQQSVTANTPNSASQLFSANSQASSAYQSLVSAINSGDSSTAQQAYSSLLNALQSSQTTPAPQSAHHGRHRHHHHGGGSGNDSTSTNSTSSTSPTGGTSAGSGAAGASTNLNSFAQIGNSLLAIGTALQSRTSADAQTALANFQQSVTTNTPNSASQLFSANKQASSAYQSLVSAINSGNSEAAQQAYSSLMNALQSSQNTQAPQFAHHGHHHHHHFGAGSGSDSVSTGSTSPASSSGGATSGSGTDSDGDDDESTLNATA